MKRIGRWTILAMLPLAGCASASGRPEVRTQLQVRDVQTRAYDTTDTRVVLKAVLDALQDDGFVVKSADANLGLVTATRETVGHDKVARAARWMTMPFTYGLSGLFIHSKETRVLAVTAHVSEFGEQARVRVSFELKIVSSSGEVKRAETIEAPEFYQAFFARIDKGLFLSREHL
jgi:hypothetical protein